MPQSILRKDSSSDEFRNSLIMKKVYFDNVEINYHKIILGDNPAVSDGAPITIGWKAHDHEVLDVDCFESLRKPKGGDLKLQVHDRAAILLARGYSIDQLAKCTQEVQKIQMKRSESAQNQKWDRLNLMAESTGKVFRRLTGLNRSSNSAHNPAA